MKLIKLMWSYNVLKVSPNIKNVLILAPAPLTPNKLMPPGDLLAILQEQEKSKLASYHSEDTLGG